MLSMARPNTHRPNGSPAINSSTGSASQYQTPRDLLTQAAKNVSSFHFKRALRLYKSALSQLDHLQPSEENRRLIIEALQSSAFLLLDEGKLKEAKEMTDDVDSSTKNKLKRALSNAYCAISELYTTDLCDEPEAESSCREAVQKATEADESNPQAWFSAANMLTIKAQNDEARRALEKCFSLYWPQVEQVVSLLRSRENGNGDVAGHDEEVEELDLEEISGMPYEAHIQMVKMMIELDMFERAAEILEVMLEEDDEHAEVLYLLTVVGKKLWINSDPDHLRYYAEVTRELCANNGDVETVGEMEELLATLPQNDSGREGEGDGDPEISSSGEDEEEEEEEVMDTL